MVPLKNSEALRTPVFGGMSGQAAAIVDITSNRIVLTESSNETKAVVTLLADHQVKTVREQPARIPYLGADGQWHEHTADLLAERHDADNVIFLVKDEHSAAKKRLWDFAENLARHTPKSVADRVQVLTSRHMPEWHNQNASLIVSARRDRRTYVDDELRVLAPELIDPVRIGDLSARLGGGQIAFRPIVRALYYGTLTYLGLGLIDVDAKVVFSGQVKDDTDRFGPPVDPNQSEPPIFRKPVKAKPKKPRASRRTS